MKTIKLQEALQQMDMVDSHGNPQPFSLSWWTCDRTRGTGGLLKTIDRAVLTKHVKNLSRYAKGAPGKKRVNEFSNQIRNVMDTDLPAYGRVYSKVKIRLIEHFNGMKVEW